LTKKKTAVWDQLMNQPTQRIIKEVLRKGQHREN